MKSWRFTLVFFILTSTITADEPKPFADLIDEILKHRQLQPLKEADARALYFEGIQKTIRDANSRDRERWAKITTKADWLKQQQTTQAALGALVAPYQKPDATLKPMITKTISGSDYAIDCVLYPSRPGLWVPGNLYRPKETTKSMPVILIAHSHHNPKHEGELQDMGIIWAKAGCYVLIIDQIGHGERREHPFNDEKSFPEPFRVGRQDYFFRYNLGLQHAALGEHLIGAMAWDLMRGLDFVLSRPGADAERTILMGAVAGGGDPVAVTGALDQRFNCIVPFNFGGPQPENQYPLPKDVENTFNMIGGGSWESTRNIRGSVDHYHPWMIVGSIAPRRLIYAHEFSWDEPNDPVWKRLQKIYGWLDNPKNLSYTTGKGVIHGNDPTASHCNNIGPIHRQRIYQLLKEWYQIPLPEKEWRERRPGSDLRCWTDDARQQLKPLTTAQIAQGRPQPAEPKATEIEATVKKILTTYGLDIPKNPKGERTSGTLVFSKEIRTSVCTYRPDDDAPHAKAVTLSPAAAKVPLPGIIIFNETGLPQTLKNYHEAIAAFLKANMAVVIVEFPGTGTSRFGTSRSRTSAATSASATQQMANQNRHAANIVALERMIDTLDKTTIDHEKLHFWAIGNPETNATEKAVAVPYDLGKINLAEPGPGLLAMFYTLRNPKTAPKSICLQYPLSDYRSLFDSPLIALPHDGILPGAASQFDLPFLWSRLYHKNLRLEAPVNARNVPLTKAEFEKRWEKDLPHFIRPGAATFTFNEKATPQIEVAQWFIHKAKQ